MSELKLSELIKKQNTQIIELQAKNKILENKLANSLTLYKIKEAVNALRPERGFL